MRRCWAAVLFVVLLAGCRRGHGDPDTEPVHPYRHPLQEPLTEETAAEAALPDRAGAHLLPLASYEIAARVLATERYYFGWQSDLSPLDLALGWGPMSDPGVDKWISWYQSSRWYLWHWSENSPYDNDAIRLASANVHIVPASTNLRRALLALDTDQIIRLHGYLIAIEGAGGEHWRSSLTREDTGDGSCELMYVTELTTDGISYR